MGIAKQYLGVILLIEPKKEELYKTLEALVTNAFFLLGEKVKAGEKYNPRTVETVTINETGRLVIPPLYSRDYTLVARALRVISDVIFCYD